MQPRDHRSLTFQQLAFGLSFMQSRNICHGPKAALKPHLLQLPVFGFHQKEASLN
uniref:Uncharacterized protein n=1 Tax=Medicago truncatula TaxID=3880 RepID=I3SGN6_MEDTR|nr:unknown [Medicago truncatula]